MKGQAHALEHGDPLLARDQDRWFPATVQRVRGDQSLDVVSVTSSEPWEYTVAEVDWVRCPCTGHLHTSEGSLSAMFRSALALSCCVEHVEALWNLAEFEGEDTGDPSNITSLTLPCQRRLR